MAITTLNEFRAIAGLTLPDGSGAGAYSSVAEFAVVKGIFPISASWPGAAPAPTDIPSRRGLLRKTGRMLH